MVIAKSDLVILLVSASLLAAGIVRWQQNLSASGRSSAVARVSATPAANSRQPVASVNPANGGSGQATTGRVSSGSSTETGTVNGRSTVSGATDVPLGRELDANSAPADTAVISQGSDTDAEPRSRAGIDPSAAADTGSGTRVNEPLYGVHIVQSGEYLGKIAQTYGTTVATLRSINGISGSLIEVDQQILYPLPAN